MLPIVRTWAGHESIWSPFHPGLTPIGLTHIFFYVKNTPDRHDPAKHHYICRLASVVDDIDHWLELEVVQLEVVQLGVVQLGVVQMGVVKMGVVQLGVVQLTPQSN